MDERELMSGLPPRALIRATGQAEAQWAALCFVQQHGGDPLRFAEEIATVEERVRPPDGGYPDGHPHAPGMSPGIYQRAYLAALQRLDSGYPVTHQEIDRALGRYYALHFVGWTMYRAMYARDILRQKRREAARMLTEPPSDPRAYWDGYLQGVDEARVSIGDDRPLYDIAALQFQDGVGWQDDADTLIVDIPLAIQSAEHLLRVIADQLDCYIHEGDSDDALLDYPLSYALSGLEAVDQRKVVLRHAGLPDGLTEGQQRLYLETLIDAIKNWRTEEAAEEARIRGEVLHELEAVFHVQCRHQVERLLQRRSDIEWGL